MIELIEIELSVDSGARSNVGKPYLNHEEFIKYCGANGINANADALEAYEEKDLLKPCLRVLYPTGLLKSRFRAQLADADGYFCRKEWKSLVNLENALAVSQMPSSEEFKEGVAKKGHPLEHALATGMPFIVDPSREKFREWSKYIVVEGSYTGCPVKKSRSVHYYSTWKLFFLDELNSKNTVSYNRATGQGSQWWLRQDELHTCSLNEFMFYFRNVATFSYRHYLYKKYYRQNSGHAKIEWHDIVNESQRLAKMLFEEGYKKWIRFLRKLIELHKDYTGCLRLIIAEEAKKHISRTVRLIIFATGYDFKRICDDVCGSLINSLDIGYEDGVHIYPRMLEEILATEEWDLRRNVKRQFKHALEYFNKSLIEEEKIPESLCEELFNELIKEPEGPALVAIRKINRALNIEQLYHNAELWNGITELSRSLEVYGKGWGFGGKDLEGVLRNLFSQYSTCYSTFKKNARINKCTAADDGREFLDKLTRLMNAEHVPSNKRLGRHLLVAHLTRNYASHQKGLSGKCLRQNLSQIYNALMNTLFVLHAAYKRQ
jgi:hypothetical protein